MFLQAVSAIPDRAGLALLVPVAACLLALAVVFPLAPAADSLPAQAEVSRPGLAVDSLQALAAVFPLVLAADSLLVQAVAFQPALVIIGAACPYRRDIDCKTFKTKIR